jgi:hypothetical protein
VDEGASLLVVVSFGGWLLRLAVAKSRFFRLGLSTTMGEGAGDSEATSRSMEDFSREAPPRRLGSAEAPSLCDCRPRRTLRRSMRGVSPVLPAARICSESFTCSLCRDERESISRTDGGSGGSC